MSKILFHNSRHHPTTVLYLSQDRTWSSNTTCHGFFCVWFVDIGGIVHHHCLNFLSIFTNIHLRTFCICYQQTLINNYAPDCVLFVYFHFIISFCGECPASKDQMIDLCSILPLYPCKEQFLFFFFCFAKKIDIGFYWQFY